jgi:hypothetical protein
VRCPLLLRGDLFGGVLGRHEVAPFVAVRFVAVRRDNVRIVT